MRYVLRLILLSGLLMLAAAVQAQAGLCIEKGGTFNASTGECTITEMADTYEIEIDYPVELVEDYPFTESTIDTYIEEARENFQTVIDETPTEDLPGPLLQRITFDTYNYFDRFVGIRFIRSEYTGGANPIALVDTFTFDLEDDSLIALGDLFRPGTDYLTSVQTLVVDDLEDQFGEGTVFEEGLEPIEANYNAFVVYNYRLIFTFDEYQVAAGAAGTPSVEIPLFRLENLLQPDVIVYRKG